MRHVKSGSGGKGDFWICVDDTYRTAGDTLSSLYGKPVVKFGADRTEFRCTTRFMGGMYKNDSTNTDTFRI